jgi:hypothetical protein
VLQILVPVGSVRSLDDRLNKHEPWDRASGQTVNKIHGCRLGRHGRKGLRSDACHRFLQLTQARLCDFGIESIFILQLPPQATNAVRYVCRNAAVTAASLQTLQLRQELS